MAANIQSVARESTIHAELLSGYTGVRITGLSLGSMSDAEVEEVRRLVSEYCVAVFPDQFLPPDQHVEVIARFGDVTVTPGVDLHPDYENLHVVRNYTDGDRPFQGASIRTHALSIVHPRTRRLTRLRSRNTEEIRYLPTNTLPTTRCPRS